MGPLHPASVEQLKVTIESALGDKLQSATVAMGELTIVVKAANYLAAAKLLRDAPSCQFEQLLDLCGIDYSEYGDGRYDGLRFCAASHLLSVSLNQRVRLKVFCPDDDFPVLPSLSEIWN